MKAPLKRLVAVAILLGWMTPGANALGMSLHMAVQHHGHHGHHGASHEHELADLAKAASHGHRHDLDAPDHDHDVTLDAPAGIPRPGLSAVAGFEALSLPSVTRAEGSPFDAASRRGPPTPLFRSHCALLL